MQVPQRITPGQFRAARAFLHATQRGLARRAGVSPETIRLLELDDIQHNPTISSINKILDAFSRAGIEFADGGIRVASGIPIAREQRHPWIEREPGASLQEAIR